LAAPFIVGRLDFAPKDYQRQHIGLHHGVLLREGG
jgi:hypothetical protein